MSGSRFHPGRYGVKGSGMGFVATKDDHPGVDTWSQTFQTLLHHRISAVWRMNLHLALDRSRCGAAAMTIMRPSIQHLRQWGLSRHSAVASFDADGNVTG